MPSDPFDRGDDLLGLASHAIDYTVISTSTIGSVQITAIVLGHLLAAVAAHDRAVRLLPTAAAVRTQYPLLAAMIALTMGGRTGLRRLSAFPSGALPQLSQAWLTHSAGEREASEQVAAGTLKVYDDMAALFADID